jgi:hypothetical protein
MEAARSSETLLNFYQPIHRHIPEASTPKLKYTETNVIFYNQDYSLMGCDTV